MAGGNETGGNTGGVGTARVRSMNVKCSIICTCKGMHLLEVCVLGQCGDTDSQTLYTWDRAAAIYLHVHGYRYCTSTCMYMYMAVDLTVIPKAL